MTLGDKELISHRFPLAQLLAWMKNEQHHMIEMTIFSLLILFILVPLKIPLKSSLNSILSATDYFK